MAKYVSGYRAQTRSRSIRYTVSFSLTVLLLGVLQVSVLGRLRPLGVVPDLMLCATVAIAFFCGPHAGAITGIGAGFLIEAMGSVGITFLPIAYLLVGYVLGSYAKAPGRRNFLAYLPYLGIGALLRGVITLIYAAIHSALGDPLRLLLRVLLPEMGLTLLCGLLLYLPLGLLCALLERKK